MNLYKAIIFLSVSQIIFLCSCNKQVKEPTTRNVNYTFIDGVKFTGSANFDTIKPISDTLIYNDTSYQHNNRIPREYRIKKNI